MNWIDSSKNMLSIQLSILTAFALSIIILGSSCGIQHSELTDEDEIQIRAIHDQYVNGWLAMDEEGIMGLLEENARIQPNRLKPIEGKSEIRKFWFPKDSSVTVINAYETNIICLNILDTLAITTHKSMLDWNYQKDSIRFGMIQHGINTTLYRKQSDKSWKIWRSMWSDIQSKSR